MNIAVAPELAGEKRAAFVGHYVIGIVLTVLYIAGTGWLGVSPDGLLVALGYGFATSVFPWILLFPALGFGFFGLKGTLELRLFTTSLLNHLSYGFGLWWIAKELPIDYAGNRWMGTTYPFMTSRSFTGAGFGPLNSDRLATPCRPSTR